MVSVLSLRIFGKFQNQMTEGLQWQWYLCIKAVLLSDSAAIELSHYTLISLELILVTTSGYIYA